MSERLREVVTCPVCLEVFKDPRMLPCQHSFCLSCIKRYSKSNRRSKDSSGKLRCAQCRADAGLPKAGVDALPRNIYLRSVLEVFAVQEQQEELSLSCASCKTVSELCTCQHCSSAFCAICEQRHVMELEDQLKDIHEQLVNSRTRVARRIKCFSELCEQVKDGIRLEVQNRLKTIQDLEADLLERVDAMSERGRLAGLDLSLKLDANAEQIQEVLETNSKEAGKSPAEKVALFLETHKESAKCIESANTLCLGAVRFIPDTMTVESGSMGEGKNGGNDIAPTAPIDDQPAEMRQELETSYSSHALYYRTRAFLPKMRFGSAFLQRPAGVAASPWSNEIYVVSMDNHRVYVFDIDKKKFVRSFGSQGQKSGEFMCPYGIALSTPTQEIFVTDKWINCVHVFNRSEVFVRRIGDKGCGKVQFKSPEAISVDGLGNIYICDTLNNRIQVLDNSGCYIRQIDGRIIRDVSNSPHPQKSISSSIFQELVGIAVSPEGDTIVVCDSANNRIHVFDGNGCHRMTCGEKGTLPGQFNNPECVTLDERGFIFVGDSGNCRVQILRPDGKFVRSIGSSGCLAGHFNWISGIAVTSKREVVVSDFKNHCVQLF